MKNGLIIFSALLMLFSAAPAQQKEFIKGADISWLQEVEAGGGVFREQGSPKDALILLRKHGFNYARLRIWHTPVGGINDLAHTLAMAKRAKENGFKLLLDFHFSDWWADPGQQTIPAAWKGLTFLQLKDSVRQYVALVFSSMKKQGTLPEMVQFGNEIICGMLWNEGNVCDTYNTVPQWTKLAELLTSARAGMTDVIAATDTVTVMIHIDSGGNYTTSSWFFDNLTKYFTTFDVIGLSYYPWWHGTIAAMKDNVEKLSVRYGRPIVLAEIAYPFTLSWNDNTANIVGSSGQLLAGYPATVDGQKKYLSDILKTVRDIPLQRGRGVFYWEPDGITAPSWSSAWENLALFGFDGEVLSSISAFEDSIATEVRPFQAVPTELSFHCYPNPFNPSATIVFTVPVRSQAIVTLYNSVGQFLGILHQSDAEPGREYRISLNGRNRAGGTYFIRLESGGQTRLMKAVLLK
ncbi:MAG: glycosyl hydrolase 53 family protein [Bacteroidota bacterium]